jgi:hypothetical protein
MSTMGHSTTVKNVNLRAIFGIVLILAGGTLFLDRYLKTGWLSLMILPAIGLFLYLYGIRLRHNGMLIAGGLLIGIGAGSIAAWGSGIQVSGFGGTGLINGDRPVSTQIGLLALFSGIGWILVVMTTIAVTQTATWWGLIPGGILSGFGVTLLFSPMRFEDFILYLALGTGLPLLLWGLIDRLIGLIIPGSLLVTAGPGIYMSWQSHAPFLGNTLVQTGIMLIWFALGWALISASGRAILNKYIWWPLIPGSILAVVGIGLYIGGDPKHALGFIGNTGSIALMVFGLYLLLMRKGIHH